MTINGNGETLGSPFMKRLFSFNGWMLLVTCLVGIYFLFCDYQKHLAEDELDKQLKLIHEENIIRNPQLWMKHETRKK